MRFCKKHPDRPTYKHRTCCHECHLADNARYREKNTQRLNRDKGYRTSTKIMDDSRRKVDITKPSVKRWREFFPDGHIITDTILMSYGNRQYS